MSPEPPQRVGYVVKRYPRYSETFVVNEVLAHESAGMQIDVFSVYPPNDTHFQDSISRVRAPVTYLTTEGLKASDFWRALQDATGSGAIAWTALDAAQGTEVREVHSAMLLAKMCRQRGIEHLHAHFATSATSVARLAAHFAGISYSFTSHAKDIFHDSVLADDLRRKLEDAAATVTVSDFNVAHLRATFGTAADRVTRVYNGMDLSLLKFTSSQDRMPLILSAGRLIEKKGFSDLIDACAILAARGVEFVCQIIGTGELESQLRAQIARLELTPRVQLLGPRPQRDVFEMIQRAAVFAAPCVIGSDNNRDGLPTVLLEAMALGTPCISTDVTGIPEVIYHGETGLMVTPRDPASLADACTRLLRDPTLRLRLARNARKLVEDEFDIARNSARLREIFAACRQPQLNEVEAA